MTSPISSPSPSPCPPSSLLSPLSSPHAAFTESVWVAVVILPRFCVWKPSLKKTMGSPVQSLK